MRQSLCLCEWVSRSACGSAVSTVILHSCWITFCSRKLSVVPKRQTEIRTDRSSTHQWCRNNEHHRKFHPPLDADGQRDCCSPSMVDWMATNEWWWCTVSSNQTSIRVYLNSNGLDLVWHLRPWNSHDTGVKFLVSWGHSSAAMLLRLWDNLSLSVLAANWPTESCLSADWPPSVATARN